MLYEHVLSDIDSDDALSAQLVMECVDLRNRLETAAVDEGDPLLYEELIELITRVRDHLLETHESLRKKVRGTMGGEVIELLGEKVRRLEREAEEAQRKGYEQGMEQGLEQGIEQGLELTLKSISDKLREQGVEDAIIEETVAAARAMHRSRYQG